MGQKKHAQVRQHCQHPFKDVWNDETRGRWGAPAGIRLSGSAHRPAASHRREVVIGEHLTGSVARAVVAVRQQATEASSHRSTQVFVEKIFCRGTSGPKVVQPIDKSWSLCMPNHKVCVPGFVDLRMT